MCRPATCKVCGRTTWAGCGQHVDQVMAGIARTDRCPGHTDAERATAAGPGLFGRLRGRR